MASSRSARERLAWAGAFAIGAWISVRAARWVVGSVASRRAGAGGEPVREIVEEVLSEHRAEDTPMVHAFEEALEAEEAEREPAR